MLVVHGVDLHVVCRRCNVPQAILDSCLTEDSELLLALREQRMLERDMPIREDACSGVARRLPGNDGWCSDDDESDDWSTE